MDKARPSHASESQGWGCHRTQVYTRSFYKTLQQSGWGLIQILLFCVKNWPRAVGKWESTYLACTRSWIQIPKHQKK